MKRFWLDLGHTVRARSDFLVSSGCFLLLVGCVLLSPSRACFDEVFHLHLASDFKDIGWRPALISPQNQTAPGPLYPAVHLLFSPLTHLQTPTVRWVNVACLAGVIFLLAQQIPNGGIKERGVAATSILAVPFLWPTAGMALTEVPALFAFSVFTLTFRNLLRSGDATSALSITLSCVSGISLGLAILGRQTYLVVVPCVAAMLMWTPRKWLELFLCIAIALLSCSWLFLLWHGLVPPSQRRVASGLHWDHGVLSISYVATATLFLNPKWMKPRRFVDIIISLAIGIALAFLTRDYATPPAKSLLLHAVGARMALPIGFAIGTVLTVLSVIWIANTIQKGWPRRHQDIIVFTYLMLFSLIAAPVPISYFSSRYVVGLLGALLLVVYSPGLSRPWWAVRMILGSIAGAATLWTYYQ
jgi:hypothetical protein